MREEMLDRLRAGETWDVLVIGGGATGLGTAVDAAARGYRTLLLEAHDFAKGTSSRSTKLVHGGVRYLAQGHLGLVREALRERGLLRQNAPHLVHDLAFVVPAYSWWARPYYGIGLKVYDLLAGRLDLGASRMIGRDEALRQGRHAPPRRPARRRGLPRRPVRRRPAGDRPAADGARPGRVGPELPARHGLAQARGPGLGRRGARRRDRRDVRDRRAGPWSTPPASSPTPSAGSTTPARLAMIAPSQGIHLVLDRSFLPGDDAMMVPHTDDGRVLFAIPWHGRALVGTTDTPVDRVVRRAPGPAGGGRVPARPRRALPDEGSRPRRTS